MRKSYLLLLAIIPLFGSCNKNSGFPNPFPNDKYNKIGFKINESNDENNEKTSRVLTNAEENMVLYTIEHKDECDKKIYSMTAKKYTRDYTRAFAGEFKSGYNVKNVMKDEDIKITKQDETELPSGTQLTTKQRPRTKTENKSETTSQYSYGEIIENVEKSDYIYYKEKSDNEKFTESEKNDDEVKVNHRWKKVENGKYTTQDDEDIYKSEETDRAKLNLEYAKYFNINQSQYITAPDIKSGVTNKDEIVLVTATQVKHKNEDEKEDGFFYLKDGRKYQAMDNNLTVTKLKPSSEKTWYLASYVRIYSETVITSEVIQPNVPVTKLKTPITIAYSEEIAKFSDEKITSPIPEVLPGGTEP